MDRGDLIALVSETTEGMREDISPMKFRRTTCQYFGVDVTPEMISRIEAGGGKLKRSHRSRTRGQRIGERWPRRIWTSTLDAHRMLKRRARSVGPSRDRKRVRPRKAQSKYG